MEPKYPNVKVQLSGRDGNVFAIIGRCRVAARDKRVPTDAIKAFTDEVMATHSYDEALQTCIRWFNCR